jgi:biotin carboxyl carrier protein
MQVGYRSGSRHVAVGVHRDGPGRFTASVDGHAHAVEATLVDASTIQLRIGDAWQVAHVARLGGAIHVWMAGEVHVLVPESAAAAIDHRVHLQPTVVAPMPGKVLQVLVEVGQSVGAGDGLVIVEAMKMEHRIGAEADAVVRAVHVAAGQMVDGGAVLIELDYA